MVGCFGGLMVGVAGSGDPAPQVTVTQAAAPAPSTPKAEIPPKAQASPEDSKLPEVESKPKTVKLPDFAGQNAAVAQDWLVDRGWDRAEDIEFGSSDTLDTFVVLPQNWWVTDQSHKPGSTVKVGTKIVLTCSKKRP
ncbi:PASTA domain-containing protein [Bailinhaonella thermotolerans]|uniref:PASTA domain-containing protein n=1 Tax=Bailinhaonella thermotolerans TaxID=1070861 RepID=A0A3A4BCC8_9ACTN|nr:PASTA domain-containing protein [Bailinhaonella thermotolerans]RJL35756.1 PASTA domain-containing protein [Bailinhaonella thermotolerans]